MRALYLEKVVLVLSAFIMAGFWSSLAHPELIASLGALAPAAIRCLFGAVTAGLVVLGLKK